MLSFSPNAVDSAVPQGYGQPGHDSEEANEVSMKSLLAIRPSDGEEGKFRLL